MKRFLCLLMCVLLLCGGVFAADEENDLQSQLDTFMQEKHLSDANFSMSYYNLTTGEAYAFNDSAFLPVGTVWTLPLHMYYYEQESLGAFDLPPEDPEEVFTINGLTLEDCRYHSILRTDNDVSKMMLAHLGTFDQYQTLINEEYGHIDTEELPKNYLTELHYSAAFLMNCLKELTAHEESFGSLTQNYSLVQSGSGFAGYGKPYRLVHILGEEDGMLCDVGIISAPQRYLLVCFTSAKNGKELLAELNELLCLHVEAQTGNAVPTETQRESGRSDSDFILSTAERNDRSAVLHWILYALVAFFCVASVALLLLWLLHRRKERRKWEDR